MKSQAFAHFTLTYLPTIAFFIFLVIFLSTCVWVYRYNSKTFYQELSNLPFKKDEGHE